MPGRQSTVASGLTCRPISRAGKGGNWLTAVMKGIRRIEDGGTPAKRWIIVLLPATTAL